MKSITGYKGLYSISKSGIVFSHRANRELKPVKQSNGYLTSTLYKNGSATTLLIHRIVAIAFIPNRENKRCVNHIDYNKHNNKLNNLEWVTYSENHIHATKFGARIGERNGNSKLNKYQILEIRRKYKFREHTHKMLSDEYGVGKNYIARIIKRVVWKHI